MKWEQACEDYSRIEKVIKYLEQHSYEQPELDEIAKSIGLSEYHFQRLFTRWAGISPKRFIQFLTKERAKEILDHSVSTVNAAFETGLSSTGRLYDLFISSEAVTPGEYKHRGEGLTILYGIHPTPFGECLIATTNRGICNLSFITDTGKRGAVDELHKNWVKAYLAEKPIETQPIVDQIFSFYLNQPCGSLQLYLNGTNFQLKVWEALIRIPTGNVVSYESVAKFSGRPDAIRAVSGAIAHNPISILIPCHRVIRKMGGFGGYRWGLARKQALICWENTRISD